MKYVKSRISMICLLMAPALLSASTVVAEDIVDLSTLGEESIPNATDTMVITYTHPNTTANADAIDVRTLASVLGAAIAEDPIELSTLGNAYAASEINSTEETNDNESTDETTNLSTLGYTSPSDESIILGYTLTNTTGDVDATDVKTLANELAYLST